MIKFLWSATGVGLYLYIVSILTQYGFYAYFNVPYSFIDASLISNVIYYYQIVELGQLIAGLITWWQWVLLGITVVIVTVLWWSHYFWARLIASVITTGFLLLLLKVPNFGTFLAMNSTRFEMPNSPRCLALDKDTSFAVVGYHGTQAILVPFDPTNYKLTNGYIAREVSQLPCKLVMTTVGKLTK
jgi:hypothetical protein